MVSRYLSLVPLEEAIDIILTRCSSPLRTRRVPLPGCVGGVTAAPVFADYSVPEAHLSAMDGIAVRSSDTHGATDKTPVFLGAAVRVNTGNVVPAGYDAVIMIEDVTEGDGGFLIRQPAAPWQHIRPVGEDIAESEMAIPRGHQIQYHDIGALAAYGVTELDLRSMSVALIPTGSELVAHGTRPKPGQVVESNCLMAAAHLESLGVEAVVFPPVADDPERIRDAIATAVQNHDLVIISAGSSKGTKDYTATVVEELGEVLVHGVAIKPGKPVIIGSVHDTPIIGLPGYPLSALTIIREIITPVVRAAGIPVVQPKPVVAELTRSLASDIGTDEFVLMTAGFVGGRMIATPLSRGAGVQMSAVRSHGVLRIPRDSEGMEAGEPVSIQSSRSEEEIRSAIILAGSHDPILDNLADLLSPLPVHSAHIGSMGGILALKRRHCHCAPMHLLADDGTYNIRYLERYMPGEAVTLVCVAEREQGIVSRDGITFDDLADVSFVNRQKGSGTRMLLDHLLRERGIDPGTIQGYNREMTTHLAVALAVKSGEADAGLCVASAARTAGLSFVPVGSERYELAIMTEDLADPRIDAALDLISSDSFRSMLEGIGGYRTELTGTRQSLPL
ncbi:MAG: molybdopterin biosynthesis protein [Methanocalculus sp. MSAO_Arc1]|uniref:molybdopterin biosynthesis protein n=1 Tax=Methanocalculus TaxID=71151 RepID=UPI000FF78E22|nr:molybdopterin biosynthesis protein [Methanocalculus sp. MSAO_Arc1]MCP1662206.1 putative molybdopterin biosynthesis protein [Methanocalculus sp. AMF5]RQD81664.1 MAG: molybdopterin biosynthesis protein [Methanocalculus sp. MSAO_Arc1]